MADALNILEICDEFSFSTRRSFFLKKKILLLKESFFFFSIFKVP